jgi:putative two-component system response regulator
MEQSMSGKILVVDDDAANRELLEEVLVAEGLEVVTAPDGRSSLQEFARLKPDLVLLDVNMPFLDGFEVCRRLKRDPDTRLTPIVLVTALSATEDRVRGIKAGADGFLSKPLDQSELLAHVRSLLNLKAYTDELDRAESVLFALARTIEGKDPCTEGHCERLQEYSAQLGKQIGLAEDQVTALRRAGIVHDIGKVAVPDAILLKPGRLTPEEFRIIQEHPLVGERICAPLKSFRSLLPIIRHHHEKLNGSGYPDGLKASDIPVTARVIQIVDVYDALTTRRPYKPALSRAEALQIMEEEVKKGWWDPAIFQEFCQMTTGAAMAAGAGKG